MNNKNSITKKSLWELPSVAIIVAAIGAGLNTTELIVRKGKRKPALIELKDIGKDEQEGIISQGTYNKYRNLLEKEKLILVKNKEGVNRRSGENYQMEIGYNKLNEQIEVKFKKEIERQIKKLNSMQLFFNQRIELINKRIKAYKLILEKTKKISQPKKTYDMLKEDFIDKPHNLDEIKDIEEKIRDMNKSVNSYRDLISKVDSFRKENMELLKQKWIFAKREKEEIRRILNTYFFWKLISNDTTFTLNTILDGFIEEVKTGELRDIGFDLSNKFNQGIYGSVFQELSKKELPNLFNIFKYNKQLNEFRGIL